MENVSAKQYSFGKIFGWIVLGVLVILVIWIVSTYNTLIKMKENIKTQLAQIEVQYQRRFDLIPNVISATQAVLSQEQAITKTITDARAKYGGSSAGTNDRVQAMNQLDVGIGRLLAVLENYPDLRSVEAVAGLRDELAGTENRISVERGRYNSTVNVYNQKIKFFPSNVVAGIFGFDAFERFTATVEAQTTVPKVDLKVGQP